jgi:hypothetical protein
VSVSPSSPSMTTSLSKGLFHSTPERVKNPGPKELALGCS